MTKPLPKLLSDQPESTDFFGAHTGIARALADLVLHDNEGRCVAIEGAWGSGKSTVIGMLKDELVEKADIFVFDTWSNQGDPLRFSFMGEFASWVKKQFPKLATKSSEWLQALDDAARQTTREQRDPLEAKPNQAHWLVAALVVGLPVGLALASDQWSKLFGEKIATVFYLVGIVLVFIPILYVVWLSLTKKPNFFKEIVNAIERTADDTQKIMIKRGPLATSLEFAHQIDQICSELHKQNPNRKLLIIFDNIDRVAERNSPKVWSLLTALLDVVHNKEKTYAKNIWVLVPVDLDSVPVPVTASRGDMDGERSEGEGGNAPARGEITNSLKREFIEKTFQVTMVVSPPLSVASERYFETQYRDAFAEIGAEKDWYECYAVLRDMRGTDESFTPRAVKRFINDLVGLYRSREQIDADHMPTTPLMCFYLCTRHKIHHPNNLVQEFIPSNIVPHITDENPIASLAAIAFGDKTSNGLLLLVKAQADSVVETGDLSKFGDLVSAEGFPSAFASYMEEHSTTWLTNDTAAMGRAYAVIGKLDSEAAKDIAWRLRGRTEQLINAGKIAGAIDVHAAQGIAYATYLQRATNNQIETSLQAMLTQVAEASPQGTDMGTVWFNVAHAYLQELVARSVSFDGIRLNLPKKQEQALQVLRSPIAQLYEIGTIVLNLDDSVLSGIAQSIIVEASNFNLNDSSLAIVKALRSISPSYDSTQACKSMQPRFQQTNAINAEQLGAAFALMDDTLRSSNGNVFRNDALNWMQMGFLHHHYQYAQGDKTRLTVRLAGLTAALGSESGQVRSWNQSSAGVANFQQACNTMSGDALMSASKYLVSADRFHDMIRHASSYNLNPFREALLRAMLTTQPSLYTADTYCKEIFPIFSALSEPLRTDLTKYAIEQLGVDGYLEKLETQDPHLDFAGYQRIGSAIMESARQKKFYQFVASLLCTQSSEWWQTAIKGLDQTVLALINNINALTNGGWLQGDAAGAIADLIVSPEFVSDSNRRSYALVLMEALVKNGRNVVVVRVANKAVASVGDMNEFARIRELAAFLFTDDEVLADLDRLVNNVFMPAIEHDANNRETVAGMVEQYNLMERTSSASKSKLTQALKPPPHVEDSKSGKTN